MHRLLLFIFALSSVAFHSVQAQEIASSFRVGLNFARIPGPSETGADGNNLESHRNTTGFHVGGGAVFKFLENYGAKAELLFSQKGGTYEYNGEATRVFHSSLSGTPVLASGTQQITIRVTNSYLEIPVSGYVKVGRKLEFQAGASIGFLVSSKGVGDWSFNGTSVRDRDDIDIIINLDHNYLSDEVFTEDLNDFTLDNSTQFIADGETIVIPNQVGAYFDFDTKDGNLYRRIDVGIHAGVSFFLSPGLFVNFTGQYGVLDATNDQYDFSQTTTDGTELIPRSDGDHTVTLQASIGFSF